MIANSHVTVQLTPDLFEYKEKTRSLDVYMSIFDAVIGQIRGALNSYEKTNLNLRTLQRQASSSIKI